MNHQKQVHNQNSSFFTNCNDENCLALFFNLLNGTLIKIVLHNFLFSGLKIKKVYFLYILSKNRIILVLLSRPSLRKPDQTGFLSGNQNTFTRYLYFPGNLIKIVNKSQFFFPISGNRNKIVWYSLPFFRCTKFRPNFCTEKQPQVPGW